jgi:hypothetical protein
MLLIRDCAAEAAVEARCGTAVDVGAGESGLLVRNPLLPASFCWFWKP